MIKLYVICFFFSIVFVSLFTFCSAQPTVRYEEKSKKSDSTTETEAKKETFKFDEKFDISPFRTEIKLPEKNIEISKSSDEIWYQYEVNTDASLKSKKIKGTTSGFRVQVIATDDLDEANKVQVELKLVKGSNEIYSVFEPPFYKILMGDFRTSDEANSLRFKLNQLGYSDSKVVKSTINLFE